MITISIPDLNDSLVEVELDDEVFFLRFTWNESGQYWTMSIENAYNDELVSCLPLLPNRPLLRFVRFDDLPLGEFVVVHNDNLNSVGRDDFKLGVATLIYMEVDDEL